MGYKKRKTFGFIDCRPNEYYGNNVFRKPNHSCNAKCLYFIFCEIETKNMSLGERIKEIRLILQRPYHLICPIMIQGVGLERILILEGIDAKKEPPLSFRGKTIIETIEAAERYIQKERKVGAIKKEEPEEMYTPTDEEIEMNEK